MSNASGVKIEGPSLSSSIANLDKEGRTHHPLHCTHAHPAYRQAAPFPTAWTTTRTSPPRPFAASTAFALYTRLQGSRRRAASLGPSPCMHLILMVERRRPRRACHGLSAPSSLAAVVGFLALLLLSTPPAFAAAKRGVRFTGRKAKVPANMTVRAHGVAGSVRRTSFVL